MNEHVLEIRLADLDDADIADLLTTHAKRALASAQCRAGHALDIEALRHPALQVWSIRDHGKPVAVGAIRRLSAEHGELKSMFVADTARGQGLGQVLLEHLVEVSRGHGMTRLSLETGASEYFDAARRLYAGNGFEVCDAFADLPSHPDSVFMTRSIG